MNKKDSNWFFIFVVTIIGFIFFRSGLGKVTGGEFVAGLENTLRFFASENPYPAVQSFLVNVAIPNSVLFGNLTMWSEIFIAVSIFIPVTYYLVKKVLTCRLLVLLGAGLTGAVLLNLTFWLSSGWTSPSTDSLNLLMGLIGIAGIVLVVKKYTTLK